MEFFSSAAFILVVKLVATTVAIWLSLAVLCARKQAKRAQSFADSFASLTNYAQLDALEAPESALQRETGAGNGAREEQMGNSRARSGVVGGHKDLYNPDPTEGSSRASHLYTVLRNLYINSFEDADFPTNQPQFWGLNEVYSVALLQRARARALMRHFCDDSDLCLNFYISYGRVVRYELARLKSGAKIRRMLAYGFRSKDFEGQLKEFTYRCDLLLAKFERHWLRCDVMNNLEFPREFEKWQRWRF